MELLHSKGETVYDELLALPGVETQQRESSPVPPLLLSSPPAAATDLKPLKSCLSYVNSPAHHIWITDVSLAWWVMVIMGGLFGMALVCVPCLDMMWKVWYSEVHGMVLGKV